MDVVSTLVGHKTSPLKPAPASRKQFAAPKATKNTAKSAEAVGAGRAAKPTGKAGGKAGKAAGGGKRAGGACYDVWQTWKSGLSSAINLTVPLRRGGGVRGAKGMSRQVQSPQIARDYPRWGERVWWSDAETSHDLFGEEGGGGGGSGGF